MGELTQATYGRCCWLRRSNNGHYGLDAEERTYGSRMCTCREEGCQEEEGE